MNRDSSNQEIAHGDQAGTKVRKNMLSNYKEDESSSIFPSGNMN